MNNKVIAPVLLFCAVSLAAGDTPLPRAAFRDAPRHEDIAERFAKEQQKSLEARERAPLPPVEDRKQYKPQSLKETSEFLSSGGMSTLVPKGAVLHIPDSCKQRMQLKPGTQIVTWAEFFRRNRGWITTMEVTRDQALGRQEFPEKVLESIDENPRVVVATYSSGPISVLKPQPEAELTAAAEGESDEEAATIQTTSAR